MRAGTSGREIVNRVDRALGVAVGAVAAAAIAWASHVPITAYGSSDAVLRVAWGARPERIESCRRQSDEELARLPAHMRQRFVCEGTTARYRLLVLRDGAVLTDDVVRGGGVLHDRQLYVYREIPTPAGDAVIDVRFVRLDSTTASGDTTDTRPDSGDVASGAMAPGRTRREADERSRRRGEAVPAYLSVERRFKLSPRTVVLVTYDPERRQLVAVEQDPE